MKKLFLAVLLIVVSVSATNAQTLKELLYSGKLKSDSGSVVRKSDDLSTKIDTAAKKKSAETSLVKEEENDIDTTKKQVVALADTAKAAIPEVKNNTTIIRDNNRIWKEYMDSIVSTVNTEVLPDRKIKKGTYYCSVDYEISAEGLVTVRNIILSPESSALQQQLKDRVSTVPPRLTPVTGSNGVPRKTTRKYNFTLTKG